MTATALHDTPSIDEQHHVARVGVFYALLAYGVWGLFPVMFKVLAHVDGAEVLAHRILWSMTFLVLFTAVSKKRRSATAVFLGRAPLKKVVPALMATATLISVNWFLFIWAVTHDQVLQASLGYFINPLVSVLFGFVFLRERLRQMQAVGVALAAVAVIFLTITYGQFPWIALVFAFTFGLYGLIRKVVRVEPLTGLTIETAMLAPLAVGYLIFLGGGENLSFGHVSRATDAMLVTVGVVTALPLLWFAHAAKRLRLATLGLLQYIAPTGHFLLAVFAYHEPFGVHQVITFACIWIALTVYSVDSVMSRRRARPPRRDRLAARDVR